MLMLLLDALSLLYDSFLGLIYLTGISKDFGRWYEKRKLKKKEEQKKA